MESPNTDMQGIELNPSCLGQVYSNRPGTGHGYKSTEPGCILTVLCLIYNLFTEKRGCLVGRSIGNICAAVTNEHLNISLNLRPSENPLKKLYGVWSGSKVP